MKLLRIFNPLRSLKLTVALIVCLSIIFLLGLTVPQKGLLGFEAYARWRAEKPDLVAFLEFLTLTSIYRSPVTIVVWGLFFLNLIAVMMDRVPVIWKRVADMPIPDGVSSVAGSRQYEVLDGVEPEAAIATLRDKGYRVYPDGGSFWAVKNRISPLATVLFHLSFLLLLAGGVVSFYTHFTAETALVVGETFSGQYRVLKRAKVGGEPRTVFTVVDIKPAYRMGVPVGLTVTLDTPSGRKKAEINRPYTEGPLSFVIKDIDMAPLFIVRTTAGREIDGAYVKLKVLNGKEDTFSLGGYDFAATFFPDAEFRGATTGERQGLPQALQQVPGSLPAGGEREVRNPAFSVSVFKNRRLTAAKTIKPGETVEFDGRRLHFAELTYWVKFLIVRQYGVGIVYAGIALMTIAISIRFLLYRRDIRGIADRGNLHVGGRGDFYEVLFKDEFARIVQSIRKRQDLR